MPHKNVRYRTTRAMGQIPLRDTVYTTQRSTWFYALGVLVAAFFIAFACSLATPSVAHAKSYTMTKADINATVASDGSMHVVEKRTFDFDGSFSAVWWTFKGLSNNQSIEVNSAAIQKEGSSHTTKLKSVAFDRSWRTSGGPSGNAWSMDVAKQTAYVFFKAEDTKVTVTLDYTVENAAVAYKDIGELYWQYNSDAWGEDTENVTAHITLPKPSGATVTPGDNVRAWGHGPLDGTVTVNTDGTIDYSVPLVKAGQYAEARVTFPTSWLSNVPSQYRQSSTDRLDTVLSEESKWADQANAQRIAARVFLIAWAAISVLAIVFALIIFFKWGRELKPTFTDTYWRDVPSPDYPPAVIGRLIRFNERDDGDFTVTIMHLANLGAIRIEQVEPEVQGGLFSKKKDPDYRLTRNRDIAATLTDPIDIKAMEILFDQISAGTDSILIRDITSYGMSNPDAMSSAIDSWHTQVGLVTNGAGFFEDKSSRWQGRLYVTAVVLAIASVIGSFVTSNFWPLIFAIPSAAIVAIIAHYTSRRTQKGADLYARSMALKKWICDFTRLKERPTLDIKVWGEFMVYAYLFGVSKKVMQELRDAVPNVAADTGVAATSDAFVPWWVFMGSVGTPFDTMFTDAVNQAIANTVDTASFAGGGFSDGFGGGGGAR